MGRLMAKLLAAFMGAMLTLVAGFTVYLKINLPQIKDAPKAPVVAIPFFEPDGYSTIHYQGEHPRVSGRPAEHFPFPIALGETGPIDPLFAGPNRHPFLCGQNRVTGQQALIDNQDGYGVPVFEKKGNELSNKVIGYSLNCSHPSTASLFYNRVDTNKFFPLEEAANDIETITLNGKEIDFIVRVETGTINRHHYIMTALSDKNENLARPEGKYWNKRLIYQFRGGVGIGKRQGKISLGDVLGRRFEEVKKGYAVVYSTANQTSNHYNMWLAEDTALRVKRQFVGVYGEPDYTVGIGGSGGAIQQYLIAQNNPELLDAAIPLYSYPDMVTQTVHVMDCEPLEFFFDVTDAENQRWQNWENRTLIEGMNAIADASNRFSQVAGFAQLLKGQVPNIQRGASECIRGWRGLTPLVHNPQFVHFINSFAADIGQQVHWTHWDDLKQFYGVNQQGFANSTWDNVGVQYGLQALVENKITVEEFLDLNTQVGGWKPASQMLPEKLWLLGGELFPIDLSFWSHHNMTHNGQRGETAAIRTRGSLEAMEGAYRSGHVFVGYVDIPIVDARHYLENDLDMHHTTASFATRLRLLKGQGYADNQLIWMSDKAFDPSQKAFEVVDQWMKNLQKDPNRDVLASKPKNAVDQCFDEKGTVIAAGRDVWDGDWNQRPRGACTNHYPRYKTSREVAGDGIAGDVFKCHLQTVEQAIKSGVYGDLDLSAYKNQLENIFPDGVCDYAIGDLARPSNLFEPIQQAFSSVKSAPLETSPLDANLRNVKDDNTLEIKKGLRKNVQVSTLNSAVLAQ